MHKSTVHLYLRDVSLCVFSCLSLPVAVISEHDTTASDGSDTVVFIAHDLSAVEEEHSTDVQSDHDKEAGFLSDMYVVRDYYESSKKITFKYGEIVEVLDTARDDQWLVRKKVDSMQVSLSVSNTFFECIYS